MCTCAHPYGRAGRCGFDGRGVTNGIRADPCGCAYGSVCGHRAHGARGAEMGHTACHMGRHWMYSRVIRGRFLDICLGQCADICIRMWAWDGTHDMAYGSALDEWVGLTRTSGYLRGGECHIRSNLDGPWVAHERSCACLVTHCQLSKGGANL
jgi:hypothetical protein